MHQGKDYLFPQLLASSRERKPWLRQLASSITRDAVVFCRQSFLPQTDDLHVALHRESSHYARSDYFTLFISKSMQRYI